MDKVKDLAGRMRALSRSLEGDVWEHPVTAVEDCEAAAELLDAIDRSGLDVSLCMECGAPVVCIPDGMPMCEPCAKLGDE